MRVRLAHLALVAPIVAAIPLTTVADESSNGSSKPGRAIVAEDQAELKLAIRAVNAESGESLRFLVTFENVSEHDTAVNLGKALGNGKAYLPDAIRLILVDSEGASRELHFSDKRYPGFSGRIDDYIVPLRAGSTYSLSLRIQDFWCPDKSEFKVEVQPGKYLVRAEFAGSGAQFINGGMEGLKHLRYWTGPLASESTEIVVGKPI